MFVKKSIFSYMIPTVHIVNTYVLNKQFEYVMKSDEEHRIDKDNVACVCKEMYIVIDISKVIGS